MERRKYLGRANEEFIKTFTSQTIRIDEDGHHGYAALVQIAEVHRPMLVGEKDAQICIADDGYSELCYLPDNENWQAYAIYDNNGCIVEWYFDISRKNAITENGKPYCDDMYLDAALMPDGKILILDEDELLAARNSGNISQEEFDMAYNVLDKSLSEKIIGVDFMETLFSFLQKKFGIGSAI